MISSDDDPPPDPQKFRVFKINSYAKDDASASESEFDLDLFKSLVADLNDTNNPLPSFSIRDYVCNSRSKDITCNWPFSHKTLQTCLQHGVKNLLPPFESLESLRNNSSVEIRPSDEEIVTSSDGKPFVDEVISITSLPTKSNPELTIKESLKASSSGRQTHLQEDLAHTKSKKTALVSSRKTENPIKKCRLGAKSSIGVEPIEENFIVSETMACKVCPVCKTFSSSSNTTLNAHIDQCLSGESSMKWAASPKVIVKHRIKPRKTRLMVDIYKTAPHCTVEELDARNGTSWANNSSFPSQELEFQGEEDKEEEDDEEEKEEEKKERKGKSVILQEVADHEGAVYIDTNGTKVRILSVPKVVTSDDHGARKLLKGGKLRKGFIEKKKNNNKIDEQKHQHKYLKLSPNSKKLCSIKPNRGASSEVAIGRDENVGKEAMNDEVFMKKNDLPIVRPPWACSKRTDLAKKLRGNLNDAIKNSSVECVSRTPNKTQQNKAMEFSPISHIAKKRSPLLTKPSSKHLKKKGTFSNDSGEDPLDACPLKHFKGSDVKSKGKKLLSLSRESASKINLKRKFSALKRSRVHPLSKQNIVVGTSLKTKSREEEEEETSGKSSSESMNLPNASRSSNGDPLCDVAIDAPESSMALNPQVTKLVNLFDSREPNEDKEMYGVDFIERAMCIDNVRDDMKRQQTYVPEVDPLLIPEAPGSLIFPVSEQLQRTSEEHHHHDRDSMSDSPISTISNPSIARSDSDKFFVRSTSLKEDHTRGGFSGAMVDAANDKNTPIATTNSDHWRSKGTIVSSFKNYQPCCCSRKEGVSSSYHESTFLRKYVGESFNFQPQMFSISNYPIPQQPPPPPPPLFPESSECDSVRSPSKPVLRLMGKNLTVVKSDEDESLFRPPPQITPMPQFSNVKNEYSFSSLGYHHVQNPVTFNQNQNGGESHSHSQYQYPPMFQPPNNSRSSHTLDTMFRSSSYVDTYSHGSPMMNRFDGQMMMSGSNMRKTPSKEVIIIDDSPGDNDTRRNWGSSYPSQSSMQFNNGSFQTCLPFREVVNNDTLGKWNHTQPPSSSRSSGIYYPPSFS